MARRCRQGRVSCRRNPPTAHRDPGVFSVLDDNAFRFDLPADLLWPQRLVDAACARGMHGSAWRNQYEEDCMRHRGLNVEILPGSRNLTSAFGDQRSGRSVRIPVPLGRKCGDIVSTDMDGCDTPQLIPLATQMALAQFPIRARGSGTCGRLS